VAEHLTELLLNQLAAAVEALAQLKSQLIDLLLHKRERRGIALVADERVEPSEKKPAEECEAKKERQQNEDEI
jgi:hypothetical protein